MKTDYPFLGQGRFMKTQTETETQTNEAVEALIAHRIEDLDLHPDSNEEIMELDKSRQLLRAAPAMLEALREVDRAWAGDGITMAAAFESVWLAMKAAENLPTGE